jgi:hypothetical protein
MSSEASTVVIKISSENIRRSDGFILVSLLICTKYKTYSHQGIPYEIQNVIYIIDFKLNIRVLIHKVIANTKVGQITTKKYYYRKAKPKHGLGNNFLR